MRHARIGWVLGLAAFLAGCQGPCDKITSITGPKLTSGTADFTRYVAAGTSISAGWQSGGLVDRHQVHAFPALFAIQVGKTVLQNGTGSFSFDAISQDGIPALDKIQSFSPLIISNTGQTQGAPENFSQNSPYQNLGVPGALAFDVADTSSYYANVPPINRSDPTMFSLIVRHMGSLLTQVLEQQPTFISFEYGSNEVLGAATAGSTSLLFPSALYAVILTGNMNAIHTAAPNAKLALFNVPNVTSIPFCTTFKPFTALLADGSPAPLIGPGTTALSASDLVLLTAADSLAIGTGIPVGGYNYVNPLAPGNGRPLLDSQVLSVAEQSAITQTITDMNAAIDSVSQRPWIAKVDMNGLLSGIAANGVLVGPTLYTGDFVTGGLFSLDGVHPNDLAHALLANTMIDAVNARFSAAIPRVNPSQYATVTASAARPATGPDGRALAPYVKDLRQGFRMLFPWRH